MGLRYVGELHQEPRLIPSKRNAYQAHPFCRAPRRLVPLTNPAKEGIYFCRRLCEHKNPVTRRRAEFRKAGRVNCSAFKTRRKRESSRDKKDVRHGGGSRIAPKALMLMFEARGNTLESTTGDLWHPLHPGNLFSEGNYFAHNSPSSPLSPSLSLQIKYALRRMGSRVDAKLSVKLPQDSPGGNRQTHEAQDDAAGFQQARGTASCTVYSL